MEKHFDSFIRVDISMKTVEKHKDQNSTPTYPQICMTPCSLKKDLNMFSGWIWLVLVEPEQRGNHSDSYVNW